MNTESSCQRYKGIEEWHLREILSVLWQDQAAAVAAVYSALPAVENAAQAVLRRVDRGQGRLVYVGAGTSGVLAALDALELSCTFGWDEERLAVARADSHDGKLVILTGSDDDTEEALTRAAALKLTESDVVIAASASGETPYTVTFAETARKAAALTVGIACRPGCTLLRSVDYPICVETGAEVVAGSTRLKAGTAQKAVLNALSTSVMIRLGRVADGRMVFAAQDNAKLRLRAEVTVAELAGVDNAEAREALDAAGGDVGLAVLLAAGCPEDNARLLLRQSDGRPGAALARWKEER